VLPWGPLGAGFLTGRYTRNHMPEGRVTQAADDLEEAAHRRAVERNFRVVDAATAIAARRNRPIAQIALAWLLGVPGVAAPIIGPRTLDQLDGILGATEIDLDADERRALEEPAPPPQVSPHRMLHEQIGLPDVPSLRRPLPR
jgi:aryl-alcohol dehydrogenase-like predicted oxidoreductase